MAQPDRVCTDRDTYIEVWSVLEALTVSFDRIGSYWQIHGEEAGKQALIRVYAQ